MVGNASNGKGFSFSLALASAAHLASDKVSLGLGIPREVSAFSMTFEIPCPNEKKKVTSLTIGHENYRTTQNQSCIF